MSNKVKPYLLLLICPIILIGVFYQIFFVDYAYLDDAFQLWHNKEGINFTRFNADGRWLTGIIINKLFGNISTIAALKYLRVLSFGGWMIATLLFSVFLKKWLRYTDYPHRIWTLLSVFICSSISLAIYIGWAACLEVFLAFILGLCSGDLLFSALIKHKNNILLFSGVLIITAILGVISLFIYQTALGAFLIPFFIYYLSRRYKTPDRTLITGLVVYLVINVLYFLLFKYSMKLGGYVASNRTDISYNVIDKISFFFSTPLAQALSFNFLYNISGIFSQVFYYGMLAFWIVSVFILDKQYAVKKKILHVVKSLLFLCLLYLPVMVARENFASYRTMMCLNLAGFILLTDTFLSWIKEERWKNVFVYAGCIVFPVSGFMNFNHNFINPLKEEQRVLTSYLRNNYTSKVKVICFIRPPEFLFKSRYGINPYTDEFGVPSTFKDWTPDPLLRQIITEITADRSAAEKIDIIQFAGKRELNEKKAAFGPGCLVIDMDMIFNPRRVAE